MRRRSSVSSRVQGTLRGALLGLLGAAAIVAVAALVVWPIWYLATAHTGWYTALALLGVGVAIVYFAVLKRRRRRAESGTEPRGS